MDTKAASKFLSYVLRHHPESIGIEIDENGWAKVSALIEKAQNAGRSIDREVIIRIIQNSNKQRFILSSDENYIRAGYGHSIDVDLQLKPKIPPEMLYHGTARQNITSILTDGIKARSRNFVHLSATIDEAHNVGSRHGKPGIFVVFSERMTRNGYDFYQSQSEESIWLTSYVPPEYLKEQ